MKTAGLLVLISVVFALGPIMVGQSNASITTKSIHDDLPGGNKKTESSSVNQQLRKQTDQSENNFAVAPPSASKLHRPTPRQAKATPVRQLRLTKAVPAKRARTEFLSNTLSSNPSNVPLTVPKQKLKRLTTATPLPTQGLNGQQFRNLRDPVAHLAVSGGPARSLRGAAAINGTDMKRKP